MKTAQKIFQDIYIVFAIIYILIVLGIFQLEEMPICIDIIGMISTTLVSCKMLYSELKGE